MGTNIPVFFMPLDEADLPGVDSWEAVWKLIEPHYDDPAAVGLRTTASRNGWHLDNALEYAKRLGSDALSFLRGPYSVLTTPQIAAAIHLLVDMLAEMSQGIDRMATTTTEEDNELFLKLDMESRDPACPGPDQALAMAYREAKPSHKVEVSSDAGYGAAVDYFSFLKSLLASLVESLAEGKSFLFVSID